MSSSATSRFPISSLAEGNVPSDDRLLNGTGVPVDVSDDALMARLKDDDKEAFRLLFHRYARVVRSIGRRILRDDTEADDLVQDVFLFIQRKCAIFDSSKSSASSWIVHVGYQQAIGRRRYLTTRHFYNRVDIEAGHHIAKETIVEDDYSPETVFGRNGLQKVMGSLSKDQQETLRLHFFEGYALSEISVKTGQPLGNVRHHYYRALDKLRKGMFGRKVRGS